METHPTMVHVLDEDGWDDHGGPALQKWNGLRNGRTILNLSLRRMTFIGIHLDCTLNLVGGL